MSMISLEQMRRFYLTGEGLEEFAPTGPLRPAVLDQLQVPTIERNYPLYFSTSERPQPLFRRLGPLIDPTLHDYLEVICGAFAEQAGPGECIALASVLNPAVAAARARLEQLHVHPQKAEGAMASLRNVLHEGWLISFGPDALVHLHSAILEKARSQQRASFLQQLQEYAQRLHALIDLDNRKAAGVSAKRLSSALGARADAFLDASTLAEALRRTTVPGTRLEPERRERCESALATLDEAVREFRQQPAVVPVSLPEALDIGRKQLDQFTAVLKALRSARLEVESAFHADVHATALEFFDWHFAQPGEIAALPVLVVLATIAEVNDNLTPFARLVRSGMPVQILITCPDGVSENPANLPVSYQETFVLHSSVACLDHLIGGLEQMAHILHPCIAVVGAGESWIETVLPALSKSWPLYRYDPDQGHTWQERFSLASGPPPEYEQLTFTHAAALLPEYRAHFRLLPSNEDLPFLLVTGEDGEPASAVYTRELEQICSAAQKHWDFLSGMAARNVVKERDAAAETQARRDGATQAIQRVISMLTNA